jgi:acetyl esterase/lipase
MITDWDDAYANAPYIPDGDAFPDRWLAAAAGFRATLGPDRLRAGVPYGAHPRQRVDLFLPEGRPAGLLVHVHGGYWRRFDPSYFSNLAAGPLARGWAVAMPGYVLAPEVSITAITRMVANAVAAAAATVAGPIRLSGHSAGGHLATRMVCTDSALPAAVRARLGRVFTIGGVHDLRPLIRTAINDDLRLGPGEAAAESPALLEPLEGARIHAWVGADERPEFVRQSRLIANIWAGLGADTRLTEVPGRHHYDVTDALADPGSPLVTALLDTGPDA